MADIYVRLQDRSTGAELESTPYRTWKRHLRNGFKILYEVDEKGNRIEGDPNLDPADLPPVRVPKAADVESKPEQVEPPKPPIKPEIVDMRELLRAAAEKVETEPVKAEEPKAETPKAPKVEKEKSKPAIV